MTMDEQTKTERLARIDKLHSAEIQELLDCIQVDWSIHDLDLHHASNFGTLGEVLLELMQRHEVLMDALKQFEAVAKGANSLSWPMHVVSEIVAKTKVSLDELGG